MDDNDTQTFSLGELHARRTQGKTETLINAPTHAVPEDFWQDARVMLPEDTPKVHTGIRLDADVLAWFRAGGKGWQTRMNAVLRSYYEHHSH